MVPVAVVALVAVIFIVAVVGANRRRAASTEEGHGLSDSAAAAMEDVAGPILGVNAHPTAPEALTRRIP